MSLVGKVVIWSPSDGYDKKVYVGKVVEVYTFQGQSLIKGRHFDGTYWDVSPPIGKLIMYKQEAQVIDFKGKKVKKGA